MLAPIEELRARPRILAGPEDDLKVTDFCPEWFDKWKSSTLQACESQEQRTARLQFVQSLGLPIDIGNIIIDYTGNQPLLMAKSIEQQPSTLLDSFHIDGECKMPSRTGLYCNQFVDNRGACTLLGAEIPNQCLLWFLQSSPPRNPASFPDQVPEGVDADWLPNDYRLQFDPTFMHYLMLCYQAWKQTGFPFDAVFQNQVVKINCYRKNRFQDKADHCNWETYFEPHLAYLEEARNKHH